MRGFFRGQGQTVRRTTADGAHGRAAAWRAGVDFTLRLVVTFGVLALIARSVDLEGVAQAIAGADPLLLPAAVAVQGTAVALAALRWHLVMHALAFPLSLRFHLASYFKGMFFSQALPTSIGGDAIRVLDVAGQGYRKRDALAGVVIDRALGLVGLLLLALLAGLTLPGLLPREVQWWILLVASGGLGAALAGTQLWRLPLLARFPATYLLHALSQRLATVLDGAWALLLHLGIGLVIHGVSILALALVGRAVGLDYGLGTYLVVVPPVTLLTVLPISVAGWGVREGGLLGLFALLGADHAAVLAMSLLYGVVLIGASLPGLVVYLNGRRRQAGALSR